VNEGREEWVTRLGLVAFYPTLIGAVAGAVVLWRRRRRAELWVLLVPAVAVTFGAAISYGQTRFRAAAEPSLAILAAVAGVALVSWLRRRYTLTTADSSASSSDTTDAGVDGNLENASTAIP
jgi:asparagine N-glycosylation enzyme membrane subunit Stt3